MSSSLQERYLYTVEKGETIRSSNLSGGHLRHGEVTSGRSSQAWGGQQGGHLRHGEVNREVTSGMGRSTGRSSQAWGGQQGGHLRHGEVNREVISGMGRSTGRSSQAWGGQQGGHLRHGEVNREVTSVHLWQMTCYTTLHYWSILQCSMGQCVYGFDKTQWHYSLCIPLACGMSIPSPPSLPVDCNDSLYAGDQKLVAEVGKLVHTLLDQILDHMKGLGTTIEVRLHALLDPA